MISHLVYYQLVILVLLWLCIMLPHLWPSPPGGTPKPPTQPLKPKRRRSSEPKPFAGLTHKPPCPLCEQETSDIAPAPPRRPDPIPPTNRRPRTVDTSMHFCPHTDCDYRGWLGLNNLRANGHPSGGPWRQLHCLGCNGYFPEHHGTIFHGKQAPVELIVRVLACLAEGLGIRATARVFEVAPNTVLQWLVEAAEQLQAFSRYFLCDVHVNQLQLDELYAVLRDLKAGEISEDEAIQRLERSPYWVWTAMDPDSKLLLVIDVGTRTLEMAQRVVHRVVQMLAPDCVPLCLTDGHKDYKMAFLAHWGYWVQLGRTRDRGPVPKPRWMPLPELLYAQVVKSYRRRRIVGVTYRVVFGTLERVQQVLSACGRKINTAFVERLNLDIRQRVAAVGRRVNTLCQGEDGIQHQLVVFHAYHNFG
jgi:IS1 family transposase